jgi:pSer/pThr/pTyr-binding forkhead associated (FHA) protein
MSSAVKVLKHFETPEESGVHYRLVCLTGKNKGLAYLITGKRVVLGRSEKADIRVHDIKSSREHAEVIKVGKDFVLTDLGSQNGVVVNDLKIKQHVLNNGDKVIIGKTVYKFNQIEVKEDPNKKKELTEVEFEDEEFEEEKGSNKQTLILIVIALAGIFILFSEGNDSNLPTKRKRQKSSLKINQVNDPMLKALANKKDNEDRDTKKKLEIYIQKGLREYREGNYFRALEQFEATEYIKMNDPLVMFYIRKTKEALNKTIEESFLKARRDIESLKYSSAITSYCTVVRLLYRKPTDERYVRAEKGIKEMEEKLGLDEGDVQCLKEIK